jgi:hypothetical protein
MLEKWAAVCDMVPEPDASSEINAEGFVSIVYFPRR